jgi:hypothetical protein
MSKYFHTQKCKDDDAKRDAQRAAWFEQWPGACEKCDGAGVHYSIENGAPHGAGFWAMDCEDPCVCTEQLKCARCGQEDALNEDGEGPCPACGWDYDDFAPAGHGEDPCDCMTEVWEKLEVAYGEYVSWAVKESVEEEEDARQIRFETAYNALTEEDWLAYYLQEYDANVNG